MKTPPPHPPCPPGRGETEAMVSLIQMRAISTPVYSYAAIMEGYSI